MKLIICKRIIFTFVALIKLKTKTIMADLTFNKRLRLYLIGFAIGLPIMWGLMRHKNVMPMPSEIITEQVLANPIQYSKHARCRMECRNITEDEILAVLKMGDVNYSKSEVQAKPCKKYAFEGKTTDGQELRIIVGKCEEVNTIITAIDLGVEHECACE